MTMSKIFSSLHVSTDSSAYQNADILPLPPARRTWSKKTFVFFWMATSINLAEWGAGSSSLALGLSVGQALAVHAVTTVLVTFLLVMSGHGGGKWHIPFAVMNRSSWGIRGACLPLISRIILSCCWYGVQGWYGGQMVKNMIGSIWPSFYNMRNTFSPDIGMETHEFVAFIIFWILCCPILLLKPERYRIPAMVSSVIVTVAAFSIFIWALAKERGPGPLYDNPEAVYGVEHLHGSNLAWTMVRLIVSHVGAWSGGILYQSDFSRYARKQGDQMWGQVFAIPLCLFGSNVLGIFATSCAKGFFPDEKPLWKLYDLLEAIQRHGGPGARAAVFFAAFAFFLSQLCVNVVACGVVGGMDLAALFPRFINIRRGSVVIAIIGICINPWRILNTANSFISAISAFGVFLGPMSGIMLVDYHLLRGRQLKLSHLFLPSQASDYWFWHGLNWRAPVAWVLGVFPSMPGFCASVTPNAVVVSQSWIRVYYLSWILGCAISGSVHLALSNIWSPPGVGEVDVIDVYETHGRKEVDEEATGGSEKDVGESDGMGYM